ncbi:MAG: hypothetical protein NXH79_12890 [Rhodobacteraceae bacterium]|jgi:hypothetical protein|nr:hypothetical protein [Paracoccaceae bacterium]
MKTRRWMKTILAEAKKEQKEMPWTRARRAKRRVAKPVRLSAAE